MSKTFGLTWPDRRLNPNARVHWALKARIVKAEKLTAALQAKVAGLGHGMYESPHVEIVFCPPDRRRRDLDNCLASCKAMLDGIAEAIGVDDSLWRISMEWGPVHPGGCVIVTVRESD